MGVWSYGTAHHWVLAAWPEQTVHPVVPQQVLVDQKGQILMTH